MFSPEEFTLMNKLCNENEEVNHIISKFKEDNHQLLSRFTHEVSNSFTLINSTVQIMEQNNPDILNIPHWMQLSKDIKDLSLLLRELSNYNQCSKLNLSNVDLIKLITDIESSFHDTSLQKNVSLSIKNKDTALPYLYDYLCDNIKLRQVFLNIIKNAFEATKSGDFIKVILPENTPDFFTCEKDTTFMIISIVNNGSPIPADKIEEIFTPFITTKASGTGLGLPTVHKILCAHGGNIKAFSTKDLTTFSIYLPVGKNPALSNQTVAS